MLSHLDSNAQLLVHGRLLQQRRPVHGDSVDKSLHSAGEVSLVTNLQLRNAPVVNCHLSAAVGGAAIALEAGKKANQVFGERIIIADHFARLNVANGHQRRVSGKAHIGLARVVQIVRSLQSNRLLDRKIAARTEKQPRNGPGVIGPLLAMGSRIETENLIQSKDITGFLVQISGPCKKKKIEKKKTS